MLKSEIANFVRRIPKGKFVGIEFVKQDGSIRTGSFCFGIKNPSHVTRPGNGIRRGISFEEGIHDGVLKFFDINAKNANGTKGGYRSARIDRILSISFNGKHIIEDNQYLRKML